eukprot:6049347-Ditylum_brightwellii.AAC.1
MSDYEWDPTRSTAMAWSNAPMQINRRCCAYAANVAANVENKYAYDGQLIERFLGGEQERHKRWLTKFMPKQMYKGLIYKEKLCKDFQFVNIRGNFLNRGPSGENIKVTEFYWATMLLSSAIFLRRKSDLRPNANPFDTFTEPVWDCTITDYIGTDEDQDNFCVEDIDLSQLQNEGLTLFLFDPELHNTNNWQRFHSHQGLFASTGGAGIGKGARGQMEVAHLHC